MGSAAATLIVKPAKPRCRTGASPPSDTPGSLATPTTRSTVCLGTRIEATSSACRTPPPATMPSGEAPALRLHHRLVGHCRQPRCRQVSAPSPALPPSIHPSLALSFHDTLCCRHRGCWPRSCHALPHRSHPPSPHSPGDGQDHCHACAIARTIPPHCSIMGRRHTRAQARPAPGWPPSRCAHTLPKQNRVHDIETRVCGYGRYIAGACSRGLGCPLLVKAVRVACCEEWRCSCLVHRASSAPACDSAR